MAGPSQFRKLTRSSRGSKQQQGDGSVDNSLTSDSNIYSDVNFSEVASSDYGSDLDSDQEAALATILSQIEQDSQVSERLPADHSQFLSKSLNNSGIFDIPLGESQPVNFPFISASEEASFLSEFKLSELLHDEDIGTVARVPKTFSSQASSKFTGLQNQPEPAISHYSLARNAEGEIVDRHVAEEESRKKQAEVQKLVETQQIMTQTIVPQSQQPGSTQSIKSPIQRFRANRPLAVSDLVAPAWCELQYSFSLNIYGKIRRTAQMKKGGEVHRDLELQVHEFVPVEVKTREDSWGLRLWNVIQGLRALRATGMTRELDVWGIMNGEVVSGVIDEVTYNCPDPELELSLQASLEDTSSQAPADQMTLDQFFAKRKENHEKMEQLGQKVYIIDTKTRAFPNIPTDKNFKGTKIQLMIYRYLLTQLCTDQVPGDAIFSRYGLDAEASFSQVFMNEIAALDFNFASQPALSSQNETFAELTRHSNLNTLWSLMVSEFQASFSPATLSPVLTAVFRTQATGSLIGSKSVVHDEEQLNRHISDELDWWQGRREARGVEIEDAFKCRICEFAEGCHWRIAKEAEAAQSKTTKRGRPRRKSSVEMKEASA